VTDVRDNSSAGPFIGNGADNVHAAPAGEEPLKDVFKRLVDNGRAYADAEINRQKIRAAFVGSGLRTILVLGTIALILLFGALVTLMIGLVFALAPLLTPIGATLVVCGVALVVVALLLLAAKKRFSTLFPKD
jgi:hypothetical protein